MDAPREDSPAGVETPAPAPFRLVWFILWMPACFGHGLALAWVAVIAGEYFAPLLLFPLLVGVVTGATAVGLVRLCQIGNRTTILAGTVLAALVAIAGQHYVKYRVAQQAAAKELETFQKAQSRFPDLVRGFPSPPAANFAQYMSWQAAHGREIAYGYVARGWMAWLSWAVDGLLVLASSLALARLAVRQPYCNRCGSWYHATRAGRLRQAAARQVAEIVAIELPAEPASARYRLVACNGGCGPTGLALYWEEPGGKPASRRIWLSADRRNQVVQVLDKALEETPKRRGRHPD